MNIKHPYHDLTGGAWLKGNLHAHTTQSDGTDAPQKVIDNYAALGHDFLMLSDHEVLTSEATYATLDARGLHLIPGVEIAGGPHVLYVDATQPVSPNQPRQRVFQRIQEIARESGRGFAVVNHPNWQSRYDHASIEQLREWVGYLGMEIYNGVIGRLEGSSYALDKWDLLLSEGRRIWGFAHDDSHRGASESGLGWNVVYAREKSPAGVVEALKAGRFYASTGVSIRDIRLEGDKVCIETDNADRIVGSMDYGKRFALVDSKTIEAQIPAKARYVRFECWGRGEAMAWTQPFFIEHDPEPAPSRYIQDWRITPRVDRRNLDDASPEAAERLSWSPLVPSESLPGFADLRSAIQGNEGVVYARTTLSRQQAGSETLYFGYDGPIRIWLNGREIHYGPGNNPAVPDKLARYVDLAQGDNDLLVAFSSNRGRGWGFWCRSDRDA